MINMWLIQVGHGYRNSPQTSVAVVPRLRSKNSWKPNLYLTLSQNYLYKPNHMHTHTHTHTQLWTSSPCAVFGHIQPQEICGPFAICLTNTHKIFPSLTYTLPRRNLVSVLPATVRCWVIFFRNVCVSKQEQTSKAICPYVHRDTIYWIVVGGLLNASRWLLEECKYAH